MYSSATSQELEIDAFVRFEGHTDRTREQKMATVEAKASDRDDSGDAEFAGERAEPRVAEDRTKAQQDKEITECKERAILERAVSQMTSANVRDDNMMKIDSSSNHKSLGRTTCSLSNKMKFPSADELA